MKKRPNILIFNPDQMRADALGHLGNPAAHTPFLDDFAAREAVSFSNAYCQNPICVPSRCSFFTGLYPTCGVTAPCSICCARARAVCSAS